MILVDIFEPEKLKHIADKVEDIKLDMLVVGSEKKYCIERKEIFDLISSTYDGRIWNQLERLKKLQESDGYIPRLILEGNKQKLFTFEKIKVRKGLKSRPFSKQHFTGLINSILDFGVPIIYTDNIEDTILTLKNIDKRSGDSVKFVRPTIQKGSGRKIYEEQEDIISAISGIGNKTASRLLSKYNTVSDVFGASESDLALIVGVSNAKHIKEIISVIYTK